MTTDLLELLRTMKSHAERERAAVRSLDARQLFELAREGESLAQKLSSLLARVTPEVLKSEQWAAITGQAAEVRAIARTNAEIMRRSLEVVRAVRQPFPVSDAPAFVSQRA